MTKHQKFMSSVFGPQTKEDRIRQRRIAEEVRSHQGQQNPPALPGDRTPDIMDAPTSPPTGGPGVNGIIELESRILELRAELKKFGRSWSAKDRNYLGTLWVNAQCLRSALGELDEQLHAFLDLTR